MKVKDLKEFLESGLCSVVDEPEHSLKKIKEVQEKYQISDDDIDELYFAFYMVFLSEDEDSYKKNTRCFPFSFKYNKKRGRKNE